MNPFPGMPPLASQHGPEIDGLMWLVHILMAVIFVAWAALFVFILWRFRSKRNTRADYTGLRTHVSSWAEIGVAVAEGILLIGFSIPLWSERADAIPEPDEALRVRVVGQQFAWNVHYAGPDGIFGGTDAELVDAATNPIGLDRKEPAAEDDVVAVNQLHLPVDEPVVVELSSLDVVHSFYLPELRVKQDTVPGLEIPSWFTPTVTTAEMRERLGDPEFQYEIGCAQLCGLGHYRMRGFLTVETREEFDAWIAEKVAAARPSEDEQDSFWQ